MESRGGKILTGKTEREREPCSGATLSTTYPTKTEPGKNTVLRGERPATNRLNQVAAKMRFKLFPHLQLFSKVSSLQISKLNFYVHIYSPLCVLHDPSSYTYIHTQRHICMYARVCVQVYLYMRESFSPWCSSLLMRSDPDTFGLFFAATPQVLKYVLFYSH
jgi:hypothetical protein